MPIPPPRRVRSARPLEGERKCEEQRFLPSEVNRTKRGVIIPPPPSAPAGWCFFLARERAGEDIDWLGVCCSVSAVVRHALSCVSYGCCWCYRAFVGLVSSPLLSRRNATLLLVRNLSCAMFAVSASVSPSGCWYVCRDKSRYPGPRTRQRVVVGIRK